MMVFVYESRLATELSSSVIKVGVTPDRCFGSVLSVADEVRTLSSSLQNRPLERGLAYLTGQLLLPLLGP